MRIGANVTGWDALLSYRIETVEELKFHLRELRTFLCKFYGKITFKMVASLLSLSETAQ